MLKDFTKEKFDILIQAGQSNSEGFGFGDTREPYAPNDLVWYLNENFTISCAVEKVNENMIQGNYALSFAREYLNKGLLKEGRKLLILRASEGGSGFLDGRWKMTDDLYLRMMEMIRTALQLNEQNRLIGLLWHQGETDALLNATYQVHYNHLMGLVCSVRDEFGVPDLPFVAGDMVHDWKEENLAICTPVLDAIQAVCRDCGYSCFVKTEDLLSNMQNGYCVEWRDNIHFCRDALYTLGKRYFEAFLKIIG